MSEGNRLQVQEVATTRTGRSGASRFINRQSLTTVSANAALHIVALTCHYGGKIGPHLLQSPNFAYRFKC